MRIIVFLDERESMPDTSMSPSAFKHWRKHLGLSQKEAAEALGLKRRVVQYYEKGERDGDPVAIPRTVRLACWALLNGINDYAGALDGATPRAKKADKADKVRKEAKPAKGGKADKPACAPAVVVLPALAVDPQPLPPSPGV